MVNLKTLAETDLQTTLEDKTSGFGVDIILTNLISEEQTVQGQYHRTSIDIDPDTGMQVRSKKSAVTMRISSVAGTIAIGWKVSVVDVNGNVINGIVASPPLPDNTLGFVTVKIREIENG